MHIRQTVCLDLDDTLIHCNQYFIDVLKRFVAQMKAWFPHVPEQDFREKQLAFDLAGIGEHGLVKERFPLSLAEVYEHYARQTGRAVREEEREQLIRLGHEVYDRQAEPYPHMNETLERLAADGHLLCLFTGGDPQVQLGKVEQLNLKAYFGERIFVARHKNTNAFRTVLRRLAAVPEHTWMVGNSARTDVIPALECGAHAIFIPNEQEWEYNRVEITVKPKGAFIRLSGLSEVPEAIRAYVENEND